MFQVKSVQARTAGPLLLSLSCASALLLTGCGAGGTFPATTSDGAQVVLSGRVQGGQQPVTQSHVHLLQAANTAYGAASTSLLVANGTTVLTDTIGGYVTTDTSGNFSITGDYTCTAGAQVYVLATGGNPGLAAGTNNTGIAIMAGLGACPGTGTLLATVPSIFMDEVSTVATAYALAGFFTDSTHLSYSGSTLGLTGITNAGANIAAISGIASGQARSLTPNGQGTAPAAELNTLANILASCINSAGSSCSSLFMLAANGSAVPTETATAAINIAHNPGRNVSSLFALASASAPFQPVLAKAPNDFSVTINYAPATATFAASGAIAIDASGNVWGPAASKSSVVELSPLGVATKSISFTQVGTNGQYFAVNVAVSPAGTIWLSNYQLQYALPTASTFTPVTDSSAAWGDSELAVAFDTSNNAWTANNYPASFGELSPSGMLIAASSSGYEPSGFAPLTTPNTTYPKQVVSVAVDSANHIWGACENCHGTSSTNTNLTGVVAEISSTGTAISGSGGDTPASILYPSGVAIDASNNAWIADFSTGLVTEYSSTNALLSGSGFPSGGGLGAINTIAIDGSSNIWLAGGNSSVSGLIYALTNTGTLSSPMAGYQAPTGVTAYTSDAIAVDGSGNVWNLDTAGAMHETLGIASPVVTPITPAMLGKRP